MALSNRATPKYYGEFRDSVLSGEIPVCREVAAQMELIDELIENPNFYYDDKAIDGFIKFCEKEMTLTDGTEVSLLPTFKLWAEDLLSWFYFVDRSIYIPGENGSPGRYKKRKVKMRLRNKQAIIVARGGAKSIYTTFLQAYFLLMDTNTTSQIAVAPTMKQAEEILAPFKTALGRTPGPLLKFMTEGSTHSTIGSRANKVMLAPTKKGIENFLTNSVLEIRPMSVDKLQSLRCKYSTVDEWLSGDVREDVVSAIEQGASKLDNWIIVMISSEGTVRNSVGDELKMEFNKRLKGEYFDPHTSVWHYKLDSVEEVSDPEMWPKAQPNIGKTVSYETYHRDVERAEQAPAARNDILAKRFGLPMEGYTYFFTYEETLVHRPRSYWQMPCSLGADLSHGDDFTAFTFLFPLRDGSFGVKTRSYISSRTLHKLPPSMRSKYDEFMREGSLHVLEGTILDMMEVYDDLDEHIINNEYDIRSFGYDPYNAKSFVEKFERENGPYGIEKVIQGAKTESVPLGEIKKLTEDRALHFDEELMKFALGNAITLEDTNGNRKLYKKRAEHKIDNVAALVNSWVAYKRNQDGFN